MIYSLGSAAAAMAHEHSGQAPKKPDLLGGLRQPHPQASAAEDDWAFQSSPPVLLAAAVVKLVGVVVFVVAGGAVEGAAEVCWESVAVGSENEVTWGAFDAVEALSCVLVRGSLFGWVGSEGTSWAGWRSRMEAGWVEAQRHLHYQTPWRLQGLRSQEHKRQTVLQGCWPAAKAAWTSGSAIEEDTELRGIRKAKGPCSF